LRYLFPSLVIGSSLITVGWAQKKHTSTPVLNMRSQTAGPLSVSLTSAPDGARVTGGAGSQATLDLGPVSAAGVARAENVKVQRFPGHFTVSTAFGISISSGSPQVASATVMAALALPEPVFTFRLDGVTLGVQPQIIQPQARAGVTTRHLLEIEVPTSVTEKNSQLHNSIIFQVIAN
jgi:hypothetical protein